MAINITKARWTLRWSLVEKNVKTDCPSLLIKYINSIKSEEKEHPMNFLAVLNIFPSDF